MKGDRVFAAGSFGWGILDEEGNNIYSSQKEDFSAFCTAIAVDSSNKVWIGTADGLFIFDSGRTLPFRPNDILFRHSVSDVECMPDGKIIVATKGKGVIVIDKERIYNLGSSKGLTTDLCDKITVEDSLFWVCSNNGLNRVDVKKLPDQSLEFEITRMRMDNGLSSNLIYDALRYKD